MVSRRSTIQGNALQSKTTSRVKSLEHPLPSGGECDETPHVCGPWCSCGRRPVHRLWAAAQDDEAQKEEVEEEGKAA